MPKLYEYFGLVVFFYANEHEPIHVHGLYQGKQAKAEISLEDGKIVNISYSKVIKLPPLTGKQLKDFKSVVTHFAEDIVQKWVDFFVMNKSIKSIRITRKLK